jgi:tetratricopeptide (TPR) repeat protein
LSESHIKAFRAITEAFLNVQQTTQRLPDEAHGLEEQLNKQYSETKDSHYAALASLESLDAQSLQASGQILRDQQSTSDTLQSYKRTIDESSRAISNELEGPQNDIDATGEILFQSLSEQMNNLEEMNRTEVKTDNNRLQINLNYLEGWKRIDDNLAEISTLLGQADIASSKAVQTNLIRKKEQDHNLALEINQQAITAYNQGFHQKAYSLLEQAIKLAPQEVVIYLNAAQLSLAMGRITQAEQLLTTAAVINPQSPHVMYTEGMIALHKGEITKAISNLKTSVKSVTNPLDEVTFRLGLAEAHYADGHPHHAVIQWQKVLEIEPMHSVAQAWLNILE